VVRLRQPDEVVETYGSQNQNCFSSLILFGFFFTFFLTQSEWLLKIN
jgi:hypothetical protein